MGETRVDLLHLLEDLRDAYPGAIEETILTEIVANSLDSGATRIRFDCDPSQRSFTATDNGSGMQRRELARYHDIAASTKTRGQGIGFAGVGIKLGLLVCTEVVTETRRGKTHVASSWHMASRHRAPWKWMPPPGWVAEPGTAVRLKLQNPLSPLLDPGFVEATLRRQFQPLLDPGFDDFLTPHYPKGVAVEINAQQLEKQSPSAPLRAPLQIRLWRRRKPSAFGYLVRDEIALPEDRRGLAISTYGKVIRRGWDWLGLPAPSAERISGIIEVPELAACLTLNKGDFIRSGTRGATYLAYRKAIQEAVSRQLAEWGDAPEPGEEAPPREVRPLQRDLAHVLEDLARDFPLLGSLVEQRAGGQKKLALGRACAAADSRALVAASIAERAEEYAQEAQAAAAGRTGNGDGSRQSTQTSPTAESQAQALMLPAKGRTRRPGHYGLDIQFEDRAEAVELGRLMESTVWVNRAHPAYRRALASRSIGYHIALAVAMALAPLAVETVNERAFVTAFLFRWGDALESSRARKKTNKR